MTAPATAPMTPVTAPAQPPPRRRPHPEWLLPVSAGQVAVCELAALAVLATAFPFDRTAIVVAAVAVLVVAGTSVRVGGRCGYQWLETLARYLVRRRVRAADAGTPVRAVAPNLVVHTHVDRAGNRIGVTTLGEDPGYGVTIRLAPAAHPAPATLVSVLHKVFDRTDIPLSAAQLVVWSVPARRVSPVPIKVYWLALRFRGDEAPWAALARGDGAEGAYKAVSSAALRLVSDLAEAGYHGSVLDTPDLHNELQVAVGAGPGPAYRAREWWHGWTAGAGRQACLLPRWSGDAVELLGRAVPDTEFTCTSYTLRRTALGEATATGAMRVGLPHGRTRLSAGQRAALGVPVVAANGQHGEHVAGTLPLALG